MRALLCCLLLCSPLLAITDFAALAHDLKVAKHYDERLFERFPVSYSYILSTGYFVTPSARMTEEGMIGMGFANHDPYYNWNARIQPLPRLELSLNYRIFRGVEERNMGPMGFGDYADQGANFKVALLTPEESMYQLPGLAFGIEDFIGSKKFTTYFCVATQVWKTLGLEASLGWGAGRYTLGPSRGIFGGLAWSPWWQCCNRWTKGIGLVAEYDPIDYSNPEREPSPLGRSSKSPVNVGLTYNLCDRVNLSVGQIRGEALSASGSVNYNWGKTNGLFPKTKDPPLYRSPVDHEPLGATRPERLLAQHLQSVLTKQGFNLLALYADPCTETLWLRVTNCRYLHECQYRKRLQHILASLLPSNFSQVVVAIEGHGLPVQQYTYSKELLNKYVNCHIYPYEFDILTPRQNACPPPSTAQPVYSRRYDLWKWALTPSYNTFIGSRHGKFKYAAGANLFAQGFLPGKVFYDGQMSYQFASTLSPSSTGDFYNPSSLQNVATDISSYLNEGAYTFPKLYAQRSWNLGRGFFSRASCGYYQVNYAGIAGEALWYPANAYCALGIEGALLKKRSYRGLGFQDNIRRVKNQQALWRPYTILNQYFLSLYLDLPQYQLFLKTSIGGFLAHDKGGKVELTRYFDNGLRFGGWMTFTDAADMMHGQKYYNRGVFLDIPLDFFYRQSCKQVQSLNRAAWLRDAGYYSSTGTPLFHTINQERRK